jgi:hypothetical protein
LIFKKIGQHQSFKSWKKKEILGRRERDMTQESRIYSFISLHNKHARERERKREREKERETKRGKG